MRAGIAMAVAAALLASGCSGSDGEASPSADTIAGTIDMITIGTSDTLSPSVTWPEGAVFDHEETKILWEGEGEPLTDGQSLLLDVYVQSLETGAVLENTFDGLARPFLLAPEIVSDGLYEALLGLNVGARVVLVAPRVEEEENEPAIVVVVDVIADHAVGTAETIPTGLPGVTTASDGQPLISLGAVSDLPTELTVATVIQGGGAQIVPGSYISAQFTCVYAEEGAKEGKSWAAGDVRQTTWTAVQAPFEGQIGVGQVIKAWDEGLVDQTVGSRVMLVVPEAWGYPGEGTVVFVVDILDVWTPPDLPS